ncbi:MAG: DUF2232 domain-containing protein [Desulfatibacillum sp.]|nr:DUF2232 domain-containing protein [Desulfatibacillum sp.]
MKVSGRDLVSGILTTSVMIAGVVFLGKYSMPLKLALPLPMIYYRAAFGRPGGAMVLAGCILTMLLFGGNSISGDNMVYYSGLLFLGFLTQECLERGFSLEKTVVFSLAGVVVAWVLVMMVIQGGSQGYVEAKNQEMIQDLNTLLNNLQESGALEKSGTEITQENREQTIRLLVLVSIGFTLSWGLFVAWFNVWIARFLYARQGWTYPDYDPPILWKAPEPLVWVAIACFGGATFFQGGIKDISLVFGIVVLAIYVMNGVAIVAFYMDKFHIPWPQRVLILGMVFIAGFPIMLPVLTGLGLFDLWADFRKLQKKGFTEDNNEGDLN